MVDPEPSTELRLPCPDGIILATLGYLIVLTCLVVAVFNLVRVTTVPTVSLIASLLWVGLVFRVVTSNIREEGGIGQYAINRLGLYSRRHFIRATLYGLQADTIYVGYSLFGRDRAYLTVRAKAISSLGWSPGQATAMSGRDMNDWDVALWYHHPDGPQRKPYPGVRDEEVFILGPSGSRARVEALGRQVVEFLVSVGVELTPGKDECEFNTPARCLAIER